VVLTLGTLSVFRWVENRMPMNYYSQFVVRFSVGNTMAEPDLRKMVRDHGFSVAYLSYRLDRGDQFYEYRMIIKTLKIDNLRILSETLTQLDNVQEFRIAPTGD
jgi:putative Mg2+ transporter-C (MgtC) family protein